MPENANNLAERQQEDSATTAASIDSSIQCKLAIDHNNNNKSNQPMTTTTNCDKCPPSKNDLHQNECLQQQKRPFKPVTHVIFDLDGLLIDSEIRFANAIAILLKRFGVDEYSQELQERVLGMEVARGIEEIIKTTGIPITVAEFMVMEREIYSEEMLKTQLMPGVRRLVGHLKRHNIPMAIATGSTKESYGIKTKNHQELFVSGKYFQHIVFTRDDEEVKRPKPAPDVYLITSQRFPDPKPKSPSDCLVFEDSSIGVDGARAAGMQCIMIPDSRFKCKQTNATLILETLEHFQPEWFGLPPYDTD